MSQKALVAMSGGVDSSVVVYKLIKDNYEVIGVTLDMNRKNDKESINDAKKVAEKLSIQHIILDSSKIFSSNVLEYFINSYSNGETPNPCAICNKFVKFQVLLDYRKKINADFIATGHYAKIIKENNIFKLKKATNLDKDQSYFLARLNYNDLQYIKFPLEDLDSKDKVRKIAEELNLPNAKKPDSQDICFIDDNNYKIFIEQNSKKLINKGKIIHINGEILGEHNGIVNYTIGQRKGLGISSKIPIYVVKFDVENNIVFVGEEESLYSDTLQITNLNKFTEIDENKEYTFKVRSTHLGEKGFIKDNIIILNKKIRAITKGQLCCIYNNDQVIASGWIR